jgi:hypothetical protein
MADVTDGSDPDPKEDYQKKLKAFLADIPPLGGAEIASGTPKLPTPFTQATIDAVAKEKGITTDARFRKYTGWEHKSLLEKWLSDRSTTCNEFCSRCADAMGYTSKNGVGRFEIADWLTTRGLSHVWVPAESGAVPDYGDVFRLLGTEADANGNRLNHMAVSIAVVGSNWYTVESGQGGPSVGYDAILRKKRTWKPPSLRGWVSMKALLNADKPTPYWLGGWWRVEEVGQSDPYYYYFAAGGRVAFTPRKPTNLNVEPLNPSMVGSFAPKGMFGVGVSWNGPEVDESYTVLVQEPKKFRYIMQDRPRGWKFRATRLMPQTA